MTVVQNLLSILLALCIPGMIALWMPRCWRVALLILWIIAPLVVLLALAGIEATGNPTPDDRRTLLHGLALRGSALALAWLVACLAGFAVGSLMRFRRRTTAPPAPAHPSATPAPATLTPSPPPPTGWQAAHVGFAHDGLRLDGLDVWALPWRPEPGPPVMLPHPAHPAQRHDFNVYNLDDGNTATRFAAQELSNGVWGFYRWVLPADATEASSADGSLRYTHRLRDDTRGRLDAVVPAATLTDARTGALLFDGTDWLSSRIAPQGDGSLLLTLEQNGRETLFRIDPPGASFHDLAQPGPAQPLDRLAAAAAAAHQDSLSKANTHTGRRIAPDGSLMVELVANEWFNSQWVHCPRVTELRTGRTLLDLRGTDWDAVVSFPREQAVRLGLASYRHGGARTLEMDLATGRYTVAGRAEAGAIAALPALFEAEALQAYGDTAYGDTGRFLPPARPRATARNYGVALLILIGALLAIAGATFATLRLAPAPVPHKLDRVPTMSRP